LIMKIVFEFLKFPECMYLLFSFLLESIFICVGFLVAVEPVDGSSVVGFSDDGWADESPSWEIGLSRIMYSLALNFPALSVV